MNTPLTSVSSAADAAYQTWQREVGTRCEPLNTQDPEAQARWAKIAAAACAAQTEHDNPKPVKRVSHSG